MQSYTLARRIYTDLGLKRVALLRVNDRYGRFGVLKFNDASRRLGHPVVIEQKYLPGDTNFPRELRIINESRVDAIVIWGDAAPAGMILKQMREMGMKQRVFGSFRVLGDDLLALPAMRPKAWKSYSRSTRRATTRSGSPSSSASRSASPSARTCSPRSAYDTMNILLQADLPRRV